MIQSILDRLTERLAALRFSEPVTHVYNPLIYARQPLGLYLEKYAGLGAPSLLLGMNPGPWGMAQTGVPFGAIPQVRDFLGIEAEVGKPEHEHPKRPIEGFRCTRQEVSGKRLWGWAEDHYGSPEAFFKRIFVHNYCPLIFLEASGRNLTPDKIKAAERRPLLEVCDLALREAVEALRPERVIGVGGWATKRARAALGAMEPAPEIGTVLHPSPASPAANRGWAPQAVAQLADLGVDLGAGRS
ncbi:MAG: uracil-DNA glycosylase family protein [Acidobacteriota bacterium]